jgi:SRSO17 transposase
MQTTTGAEPAASSQEQELRIISQGALDLAELLGRIGAHVRRTEVRRRVQHYLQGLLASVERKNGWQLSEALGEPNAHGVQRLSAEANWDEEAVRDELRTYVLAHLGAEQAVLVVDETGFLKKGKKSAGVARQYSGTAGRRENCQIGVLLLYASPKGHAFLDRALYLPEEWTQDPVRCREAGIPEEVTFATKGELAQSMLARAFAAGVQAQWVVGDTVYG